MYKYDGKYPFEYKGMIIASKNDILDLSTEKQVKNCTARDVYTIDLTRFNLLKRCCKPVDDKVNSPSHYTWLKDKCNIEVIDITRHMDFDLGNAIKYILRCGHKSELGYDDKTKAIEDLRKAVWYINDKIKMLEQ